MMAKKKSDDSGLLLLGLAALLLLWPRRKPATDTRLLYIEPCTQQVFDLNNPVDATALEELQAAIDAGQVTCN
jgi:hypothetical protein